MSKLQTATVAGFTPGERDYIRRELDMFFSTLPTVAEGFLLKTWRDGPDAGRPKLPPAAKGLLERGLMRLDTTQRLPWLFFTDAGLAELRAMMTDRRFADPKKFAHVRQELGIDPCWRRRLRRESKVRCFPSVSVLEAKEPWPAKLRAAATGRSTTSISAHWTEYCTTSG
jgi:hypothetical protein